MSGTASAIAKVAPFLMGLNIMLPFLLCMVGSSFAMKRFGYEEDAVSIFVAFCSNAMDILTLIATVSTLVIVTILKAVAPDLFNYIVLGMSMISVCFTIVINALLLRTYALDDDVDNITRYYWLLLLANFAAGMDASWVYTMASDNLSPFEFGFAISGLVIACFHWAVIRVLKFCRLNVDYWLIVCQIVFMLGISIIAEMLWITFLIQDKIAPPAGVSTSIDNRFSLSGFVIGFGRSLPMILASTMALAILWAVYPIIAPFELVKFQYHYPIQRVCLVVDTMAAVIVCLMDEYAGVQCDWYTGNNAWWHLLWLFFIPYLGLAAWFLRCMHYPESGVSRAVLGRPFVVGPLTMVFYMIGSFLFGIGPVPIAMNAMGHEEVIAPMYRTLSLVMMIILEYMSEAHVQQFRLAKEGLKAGKAWPTDGMSKNSALRYWIGNAARVGYVNFRELASADVKQRLGSVARHIVSYRRISSVV